jgi:hypothetical protein
MGIQEIEQAIRQLSPKDLARFRQWFDEFDRKTGISNLKLMPNLGHWTKLQSRLWPSITLAKPKNYEAFSQPFVLGIVENLPSAIQQVADKNFELLKVDPRHPSLHLKKAGEYWSVRVGRKYRALGVEVDEDVLWFWIGTHAEYDKLLK